MTMNSIFNLSTTQRKSEDNRKNVSLIVSMDCLDHPGKFSVRSRHQFSFLVSPGVSLSAGQGFNITPFNATTLFLCRSRIRQTSSIQILRFAKGLNPTPKYLSSIYLIDILASAICKIFPYTVYL